MKKIFASFGWILLLLPFLSFAGTRTIFGSANLPLPDTEDRQVSGFHSISSGGSFDVFVKLGNTESLRLEGDNDLFSKIETKVENGDLKIRYKAGVRISGWNKKVSVYVTARSLRSLNVSGSGDMEITGTIKGDKLDTRVSGSGSITLAASVNTFNSSVSGSGEIKAKGSAKNASIQISGSGEFEGKGMQTDKADIKVSGSGSVTIHANTLLNAVVSGSGDIYYSGNPRVNQAKSGSGKISRI